MEIKNIEVSNNAKDILVLVAIKTDCKQFVISRVKALEIICQLSIAVARLDKDAN